MSSLVAENPLFLAEVVRQPLVKNESESFEMSVADIPVVPNVEYVIPPTPEERRKALQDKRFSNEYLSVTRSLDYQKDKLNGGRKFPLYSEADRDIGELEWVRDELSLILAERKLPLPSLDPKPQIEVLDYTTMDDGKEIKGKLYREVPQR